MTVMKSKLLSILVALIVPASVLAAFLGYYLSAGALVVAFVIYRRRPPAALAPPPLPMTAIIVRTRAEAMVLQGMIPQSSWLRGHLVALWDVYHNKKPFGISIDDNWHSRAVFYVEQGYLCLSLDQYLKAARFTYHIRETNGGFLVKRTCLATTSVASLTGTGSSIAAGATRRVFMTEADARKTLSLWMSGENP